MKNMTKSELSVLKSIFLYINDNEYFIWEDIHSFDKGQFSKQYYLRLLNSLVDKEILVVTQKNKSNFYRIV